MELTRLGGKAREWMQDILRQELPHDWSKETYFCISNDGEKKGDTVQVTHPNSPWYANKAYVLPERLVYTRFIQTRTHSPAEDTPYLFFESDVRQYAESLLKMLDHMD